MNNRIYLTMSAALGIASCSYAQKTRPNVLLILADDMGYSDIGCFGSEIPTPNLDKLANNGVRFSEFHNTSRSCPSRASLMTGLYQHQAGIGQMSEDPIGVNSKNKDIYHNDWGTDGYKGFLNKNCVTIAEVLKSAGYHTYMTGKWHLGMHGEEKWPLQRGFEKFYGILAGACSYLCPSEGRGLTYMNKKLDPPTAPYYTTDAFTDYALDFLQDKKDDKPFFMYLSYNAPHWPLQAHEEDINKFVKMYRENGWQKIREARRQRLIKAGLIKEQWELAEWECRQWNELTDKEKDESAYRMATYAAQVSCMDRNIGRVIDYLKTSGELDNTMIIFFSDNGACAEPYKELGGGNIEDINNPQKVGNVSYGVAWAQVSNTPFKKYKVQSYEGGLSTPFIINWQKGIGNKHGVIRDTKAFLPDIMATIVDATNAKYPKTYNGNKICPMVGLSMINAAKGKQITPLHEYLCFEHQFNAAAIKDNWKAVRIGEKGKWQLYDLDNDRSERNDLSKEKPEILNDLINHWKEWSLKYKVYPKHANGR